VNRDEFRRRLATAAGRQELRLDLTAEEAALILADDARLDALHAEVETRAREAAAANTCPVVDEEEVAPPDAAAPAARRFRLARPEWVALAVVAGVILAGVGTAVAVSAASHAQEEATAENTSTPLEGDLDGDGQLSGWEEDRLNNPRPTPEARHYADDDTSTDSDPAVDDDGYRDSGTGLAWKYLDVDGEMNPCGYLSHCVVVGVKATQACSSVYAEAQVLDPSGTVVGMANGTLPALSYGDTGRLKLGWVEDDGTKAKLTRLSCL